MNSVLSSVDQISRQLDRLFRSLRGCFVFELVLLLVFQLSISVTSLAAGSASSRRGDYVIGDSGSSVYGGQFTPAVLRWTEPVDGYHPEGCDNSPGLAKNLKQFGQVIPVVLMGEDSRCPLPYGRGATDVDRKFYGVGSFFYMGNDSACMSPSGIRCGATGHLVVDGDIVVTTAHTFRSIDKSRRLSDREIREFRFYSKVWIPEEMRRNKNEAYEFREYEIESVEFGGSDERNRPQEDYAFVKLKERVGQTVSPMDSSGREIRSNRRRVADDKLVRPLPFKKFDRKQVPNIGMGVGFQKDKGWEPQKNCQPFAIHDPPNGHRMGQYPGTIIVEADTNGMSSGMAYSLLVDGEPHFAGVNVGFYPDRTSLHGQFDIWNRFNWGIESNSIYDHFMEFRRKWGRN